MMANAPAKLLGPVPCPPHAPFTEASTSRRPRRLHAPSGRSTFQLRAAQTVQETSPAPAAASAPELIELPTSDESEKLLRIRHSVSAPAQWHCKWLAFCPCNKPSAASKTE